MKSALYFFSFLYILGEGLAVSKVPLLESATNVLVQQISPIHKSKSCFGIFQGISTFHNVAPIGKVHKNSCGKRQAYYPSQVSAGKCWQDWLMVFDD